VQVLLAHPGGPFWAKKDDGAWSIPKGEFTDDEEPLARGEARVRREMGVVPSGEMMPLSSVQQAGGKLVFAWALRSDFDVSALKSNTFSMEWPPRSGKQREFPEVDKAEWFSIDTARVKVLKGQAAFLDRLLERFFKIRLSGSSHRPSCRTGQRVPTIGTAA